MAGITEGPCKICKRECKYVFMFFCKDCYKKELNEIKSLHRPWTKKPLEISE